MEEIMEINLEEISLENLEIGNIVHGNILMVEKQGIWLDIGGKYNAFLDFEETTPSFRAKLKRGQIKDSVPLLIQSINHREGIIYTSQKRAIEKQGWENLIWAFENDETIEGRVKEFNGKGFIVEVGEEINGFIPLNLIDIYRPRNPNNYINRKVNARIIKLNPERKQIILSVRSVLEEKLEEKRQKLWERIKKSEIVRGRIREVSDEGLKVDLGLGILGTVSYEELSWFPIKNIYRNFQRGDIIRAKILNIEEEKKEIQLSIRLAQPNPWEVFLERYPKETIQQGEIIKITSGLVVKVDNLIGFVPPSEISWGRLGNIKDNFNVGDKVKVKILDVNPENRRILLSIKQVEPNPWEIVDEILKEGEKTTGKIINITDFGLFLEIKPGLEGFIPKRLLSWEKIENIEEKFKIGDILEVQVVEINKENRRLLLSRKALLKDPWEEALKKYHEGMNVVGKVIGINNQGVVLEIETGVEGFLPNSQKGTRDDNLDLNLNQEVEVKIISIDSSSRRIILSRKALIKEKEEKELEKYLLQNLPPRITLGEIMDIKLKGRKENKIDF